MPGEKRLPPTQQAKFVIVAAIRIAQELKHEHVETGHLLLGILDDPHSRASKSLADAGVTPEAARQAVLDVVQIRPADWIAPDAKNPYFTEHLHKPNWRK